MVSSRGKDITTEDGRVLNSYSEEYRKYCDAITVLKRFKTKKTRQKFLADVYDKRGPQGYQELYDEMMKIWKWRKENEQNT
jgi:hypothetical protein